MAAPADRAVRAVACDSVHPMEPPVDSTAIVANARALEPEIRAAADEIERERRLPQQLVDRMSEAGVFRIAMPRAWG